MLGDYLNNTYNKSKEERQNYIISLVKNNPNQKILVVGGAEGIFAERIRKKSEVDKIYTIEIEDDFIEMLKRNTNLVVYQGDLNESFPYEDNYFDLIIADQVIEHLHDTDIFLTESKRVLIGGGGGTMIVSTENLANFINIFSLIFGYYPLSLNYSYKKRIGNPFSPHNGKLLEKKYLAHVKCPTPRAMIEILEFYGFKIENKFYNGFFPFPNIFSKIFNKYSYFITYEVKK